MSTVTFNVLINGGKTSQLLPKIGLRQWDSLSPYYFILCHEALLRILEIKFIEKNISGVKAMVVLLLHMLCLHMILFYFQRRVGGKLLISVTTSKKIL